MSTKWGGILTVIFSVILVQIIGGLATASSVSTWYQTLAKPPHNPPDWVFAPVWTTLYIMIAISGCRAWLNIRPNWRQLNWFWIQLIANLSWSIAFFGFKSPIAGLIIILVMLYSIYKNYIAFRSIDISAARLLLPYLAWVAFAFTLNLGIVILNP